MKTHFFVLIVTIISCQTPEGHIGASKDISESKQRQVFVSEFNCSQNPCKINDSLILTVREAWVEKHWAYGAQGQTIITEGFQLCINTTKENEDKMDDSNVTFGISGDHYLRESSKDSYLGDFRSEPADSITYLAQNGSNLSNDSSEKRIILGKLVLVKAR